ncbi:hypothetical protein [Encephalitozoon cuniculi GB-M1]|uniref:DNA damage-binding protein 1 n=1 Tax=Encephalitozoon cuniculi (strain GB-M1) TaxID=284813 RepID=Q8SUV1_ENCCU|nr:uncharacterized protein ECU07_1670 [Encephalitozoon cuniculi GB-M1]CAD25698.1 hypothetical protein [Encephalitozoon cuniculi GB-M1]
MFYLSRAVVNTDLYMRVLCSPSDVYLVQSSSIAVYEIRYRRLAYVKRVKFFDVIKSAAIVGDELLVAFNGYFVLLDRLLNEKTRHRLGRSSMDYRHAGAYIGCGENSICLASFFGHTVFCALEDGMQDFIECSSDGSTIIDLKAVEGTKRYLLLERSCHGGTVVKIYEHMAEVVKVVREVSVPGGYLIVPLGDNFAIFSRDGMFLFRGLEEIEIYRISRGLSGDLVLLKESGEHGCASGLETRMFTCYGSYYDGECLLTLVVDEEGELYNLEANPSLRHVGKINPSKDVEIHPSGFLISIGYNSNNCMYCLKKEGPNVRIELVDVLETIKRFSTATVTFDGLYHVYVSDGCYVGEIVEKASFFFLNELKLFRNEEERVVRSVLGCGMFVCAQYDEEAHCLFLEGERLRSLYKFVARDEIVGYFRLGKTDFYVTAETVKACDANGRDGLVMKEYKVDYDSFSSNGHCIFLGHKNKIVKLGPEGLETIEIGFSIKEIEADERHLFILTGKRVLRVYRIHDRKFVFIQSFHFDVIFLSFADGCLYTIGAEIHRFTINEDGSLSLPSRLKSTGRPIGKKRGLVILEEGIVDLKDGKVLNVDGWKSAFAGDMLVIANEYGLKVYGCRKERVFLVDDALDTGGEYKIIGRESVYIDNGIDDFRIRRFDKSLVMEGRGKAMDFSSSEYQIVSVCVEESGREDSKAYFLKVYRKGNFLYDFGMSCRVGVICTNGKEVYCGVEDRLYCYEVGIKALLRKFKLKFPSRISRVCAGEARVFIGTEKDSVFMVAGRRVICGDPFPRHVVALERMSDGNLLVGDRTGNIAVMKIVGDSLVSAASIFINDMVVQFISQDRIFGVCMSGKVVEVIRIDEELFELLEMIGGKIAEGLGRPFFQAFRRNRFIDAEYVGEFNRLEEKQIKEVFEGGSTSIEKILEIINSI